MTFKQGLLKARSHIIFLIGLTTAFGIVITLERTGFQSRDLLEIEEIYTDEIPAPLLRPLTKTEKKWAAIAWTYFKNNFNPETGLVNSVDQYSASTMWDTASYLMALISARNLGLIDKPLFDERLTLVLSTLAHLKLFDQKLPNKSYNTLTGQMVDYQNQKSEKGIGWSAIDIGRLLIPFNVIVWNYPGHTREIRLIIKQWDFDAMVMEGQLFGAAVTKEGETAYLQEGRLGYEEYASKSCTLMGLDVSLALDYRAYLSLVDVYGIPIPHDSRDPERYDAHNYVVSEPYILDGIEFGGDRISNEFSYRVYLAQEKRFKETGILTAVSEDNIDQAPYFVYNTVFTDGKIWNCITETGEDASEFKSLSTKAVFGWYALYRTPYTSQLIQSVSSLYDPQRGWYSGRYETGNKPNKAVTCNTNAIILESLCSIQQGRLVAMYPDGG